MSVGEILDRLRRWLQRRVPEPTPEEKCVAQYEATFAFLHGFEKKMLARDSRWLAEFAPLGGATCAAAVSFFATLDDRQAEAIAEHLHRNVLAEGAPIGQVRAFLVRERLLVATRPDYAYGHIRRIKEEFLGHSDPLQNDT